VSRGMLERLGIPEAWTRRRRGVQRDRLAGGFKLTHYPTVDIGRVRGGRAMRLVVNIITCEVTLHESCLYSPH
jgi:hypothetical protein